MEKNEDFCGSDLNNKLLHIENGERYERNKVRFETNWFGYLHTSSIVSMIEYPVVTIPVVVHVVYKKETENIKAIA